MNLIFTRDLGMTIDTVPSEVFTSKTIGYNTTESGDLLIKTIITDNDEMRNFARDIGFEPSIEDGICWIRPPTTENITEAEGDFNENTPQAYGLIEEEEGEEEEEELGVIDRNPPGIEIATIPATNDLIISKMPPLISPDTGSAINLYQQKINEFNRIWGNALQLKRQIDEMMKEIDKDEMLKKIREDIEYLKTRCEFIEEIGFISNDECPDYIENCQNIISIKTKELISSDQPKYGRRKIGKMQILIDLKYIYSNNPPNSNYAKGIDIINLDRNPFYSNRYWVCGHVYRDALNKMSLACFGGYFSHIYESILNKNLPLLVDVLLRYIMNPCETDTWGRNIQLFPEVEHETR